MTTIDVPVVSFTEEEMNEFRKSAAWRDGEIPYDNIPKDNEPILEK